MLGTGKYSDSLKTFANYGRKKFIRLGPGCLDKYQLPIESKLNYNFIFFLTDQNFLHEFVMTGFTLFEQKHLPRRHSAE